MTDYLPSEKATTIRQPSTANLMLDSDDRDSGDLYASNFSISRSNSLLNGYFTRIGTTEVVLEWTTPNISSQIGNNTITIITDPAGTPTTSVITLPNGFYTAKDALDEIVALLNVSVGIVTTYTLSPVNGVLYLTNGGPALNFTINVGLLATQLFGPAVLGNINASVPITAPDIRPCRYLDFVSNQLTYNQDLKDTATNPVSRDVLCRWYFVYSDPTYPAVDAYGFPILMGYIPFYLRRTFSPPKQIKWSPNMPIGNLSFTVYNNVGNQQYMVPTTNWLMTLQVSEN